MILWIDATKTNILLNFGGIYLRLAASIPQNLSEKQHRLPDAASVCALCGATFKDACCRFTTTAFSKEWSA